MARGTPLRVLAARPRGAGPARLTGARVGHVSGPPPGDQGEGALRVTRCGLPEREA